MIQLVQFAGYMILFLSPYKTFNSAVLTFALLFLTGVAGMVFGALCSIIIRSVIAAFSFTITSSFPVAYISGKRYEVF